MSDEGVPIASSREARHESAAGITPGPALSHEPFPWTLPPERSPGPRHLPPGAAETGSDGRLAPWLEERLFDRRIVMLRGLLTGPIASQTAAALLSLDAASADPVQLHVDAPDGELAAAFTVVDALDAMRAPVHAVVTAQAGGAVIGVLVAARRRLAYRHARFHLAEPRTVPVSGTADEITAAAGQYLRELEELILRVAEVTRQPRSRVEDDMSAGRVLDAAQAQEYGLIDDIVGTRRLRA